MRPANAPKKKGSSVSRGLGVVIVIIAAVVIVVVAFFATRRGGFTGKLTHDQKMELRAHQLGYDNAAEMWSKAGGPWGPKKGSTTPTGGRPGGGAAAPAPAPAAQPGGGK